MARLDSLVRSDTTVMLWEKADQAYAEFTKQGTDEQRATLNKIVECLAVMLDKNVHAIAATLRARG